MDVNWTKSSYSSANGDCVELGTDGGPAIHIRNSQHPDRGHLTVPATSVADFVAACAAGELDDLTP
jgi:hypothetical protein